MSTIVRLSNLNNNQVFVSYIKVKLRSKGQKQEKHPIQEVIQHKLTLMDFKIFVNKCPLLQC